MFLHRDKIEELLSQGRFLWCNAHQKRMPRCWTEGGILLPCDIVDLTDEAEIEESTCQKNK